MAKTRVFRGNVDTCRFLSSGWTNRRENPRNFVLKFRDDGNCRRRCRRNWSRKTAEFPANARIIGLKESNNRRNDDVEVKREGKYCVSARAAALFIVWFMMIDRRVDNGVEHERRPWQSKIKFLGLGSTKLDITCVQMSTFFFCSSPWQRSFVMELMAGRTLSIGRNLNIGKKWSAASSEFEYSKEIISRIQRFSTDLTLNLSKRFNVSADLHLICISNAKLTRTEIKCGAICFLFFWQAKSRTDAIGRNVSGVSRAPTSWRATTANTRAPSRSAARCASAASPVPITWRCTWSATCPKVPSERRHMRRGPVTLLYFECVSSSCNQCKFHAKIYANVGFWALYTLSADNAKTPSTNL